MQETPGWKHLFKEMTNAKTLAIDAFASSNDNKRDMEFKGIVRGVNWILTQLDNFMNYKDTDMYKHYCDVAHEGDEENV